MQRSINKRSLLENIDPVEPEKEPLIVKKSFCPMPPRRDAINNDHLQPSRPLNEIEALQQEYIAAINNLRNLRSKLYRLGIDPDKITN